MRDKTESLPDDRTPEIRVQAMPANTNAAGDIFGGWLMSQVDIAGSIEAIRCAGGRVVTVAVNEFTFLNPVFVGDLVSIYASLVKTGKTSITIAVDAYAERRPSFEVCHKVATAVITYVAVDDNRRPRPVVHR